MTVHSIKKFLPVFICIILTTLSLCSCGKSDASSIIKSYGNNILIVDSDSVTNGSFQDLCEVTQSIPIKSNKHFKFIVISETNATTSTKISELKNKVLEGYTVIYPQTNKDKLNNFLKSFSNSLENTNNAVNGCVLKRDLNTTTQAHYIQATPSYSNTVQSSTDFIKSKIESAVTLELPYKDRYEFLGVYISKAVYSGSDFKEITPFSEKINFDKFDTFNNDKDKHFTFSFDDKRQSITYSTCYEIGNTEMEFFYAYVIVKDFYGNVTAIPIKSSVFTHSGIAHTLTETIPVYSGERAFADVPELLKITFNLV